MSDISLTLTRTQAHILMFALELGIDTIEHSNLNDGRLNDNITAIRNFQTLKRELSQRLDEGQISDYS